MFYDNFKKICSEKGIRPTKVISDLGLSSSNMTNWKNGRTPKTEVAQKIADYLGVSLDYLLGNTNSLFNEMVNRVYNVASKGLDFKTENLIPVLGCVRAGYPMYAEENIIDYEEISNEMARSGEYFALKVKGDSMIPRFVDGDIVIVKKCETVENGEIAIVMVGQDEATIKKFYRTAVGVQLVATNPNYPAMTFTPEQVDSLPVTISGKVVELRAKF